MLVAEFFSPCAFCCLIYCAYNLPWNLGITLLLKSGNRWISANNSAILRRLKHPLLLLYWYIDGSDEMENNHRFFSLIEIL